MEKIHLIIVFNLEAGTHFHLELVLPNWGTVTPQLVILLGRLEAFMRMTGVTHWMMLPILMEQHS